MFRTHPLLNRFLRLISVIVLIVAGFLIVYNWFFPPESNPVNIYWFIIDKRSPLSRLLVLGAILALAVSVVTIPDEKARGRAIIATLLVGVVSCGLVFRFDFPTTLIEHRLSTELGGDVYHLALRTEFWGNAVRDSWYELYHCDGSGWICTRTDFRAPHILSVVAHFEEALSLTPDTTAGTITVQVNDNHYAYHVE